jgi:hypothetical protein
MATSDPFIIPLTRGERLVVEGPASQLGTGAPVDLSQGGYTVRAKLTGKRFEGDLGATITNDGKVRIDYDTAALVPGDYLFDICLTLSGVDAFTPKIVLRLERPESDFTPR